MTKTESFVLSLLTSLSFSFLNLCYHVSDNCRKYGIFIFSHHFIRPQALCLWWSLHDFYLWWARAFPLSPWDSRLPVSLRWCPHRWWVLPPSAHLPWKCLASHAASEARYWLSSVYWFHVGGSGFVSARPPKWAGMTKWSAAVVGRREASSDGVEWSWDTFHGAICLCLSVFSLAFVGSIVYIDCACNLFSSLCMTCTSTIRLLVILQYLRKIFITLTKK